MFVLSFCAIVCWQLQDKLRMAPAKMTEKENAIKRNRAKYEKLIVLRPVKDNVSGASYLFGNILFATRHLPLGNS